MPNEKPLIYLVAPAGHPNFGDEYIVAAWLRELAHRRPRASVILDCHTPGVAAVLHHSSHPGLTVTDTLWRLADHAEDADQAYAAIQDPGRFPNLVSGLFLADRADIIQVLGGGWLNDHWPRHEKVIAAVAGLGEPEVRRVATGQGLTPARQVAGPMVRWWEHFEWVGVRDEPSLDVLPTAVLSPDDAWLAAPHALSRAGQGHGTQQAREREFLVSAQSDLLGVSVDALAGWLVDALHDLGATGPRLAFVECIPRADALVWERMCTLDPDLCSDALFVPFHELWAQGLPARAGQTWLSTRYHPHLVAAARGAHGVAVVAHTGDYYSVKHSAVGSEWPVVRVDGGLGVPTPGAGFDGEGARRRQMQALQVAELLYPTARAVRAVRSAPERVRPVLRRALRRG